MKLKNKKGFTLIELVVCITILGILIALAVPSYMGARDNARHKVFDGVIRDLEQAGSMFALEHPGTAAIWAPFAEDEAKNIEEVTSLNVHDSWSLYMDKYPADPTREAGSTFVVEIDTKGLVTVSPSTYGE